MSEIITKNYNENTSYNDETSTYNTVVYTDGSMTNEKLNGIIELYRSNIFILVFDNNKHIFVGYQASPKITDISLITIGNVDFVKVNNKKRSNQKEIEYFTLYRTDCLQSIGMMNDGFTKYGPDPMLFL